MPHDGRWRRRIPLHLDPEDARHDRPLDTLPKLVEHLEGFVLVLDQWVALPIGAQADALAEVLHLRQVFHPLPIDRAQHHVALDHRHEISPNLLDLSVVSVGGGGVEMLGQAFTASPKCAFRNLRPGLYRQIRGQVLDQALQVPVLDVSIRAVLIDSLVDDVLHVAEDVGAGICPVQHLVPFLVDDLALLVHHVVVLDDVLAGVEVESLDLLLRALDRAGHPAVLDRLHLELVHQLADPVGGGPEDLHQVVLEGDEKAAGPGVTLASGTPAELVVDAPRLVALGADYVESTGLAHAVAEDDVGTAAGHVGGDHHSARLPGVLDDLRLTLVLLGVQDAVRQTALLQHPRQALRLLDGDGADQDRAAPLVHLQDLVDDRLELRLLGLVDDVRVVIADHRLVGRDGNDLELVDLVKLLRLGHRRTGHAGQLGIEAEEVLEGDGGKRLLLLLHLQPFLGLDRLVEAVRPTPALHQPACELVDDDDLAILDQIFAVA